MNGQSANLNRKKPEAIFDDAGQPFLAKLEEIVLKNIDNEQFGVQELAGAMKLSRFQIYRKLNILTGKSISQFIRQIRLRRAMELLRGGNDTISGIAYEVGFGSATYFTKCFHDYFHMTPGAVRNKTESQSSEAGIKNGFLNSNGHSKNDQTKVVSHDSIAVLPFVNMSDDPEQEYFCDGISEEIINTIAQFPDLKVAGRTSSFSFKGRNIDIRHIGKTLGVSKVLEGSIRKSGNLIRITVQLLETSNGYHIWSKRYDRTLDDVFAIQDEIALEVGNQLKMAMSSAYNRSIARKHTLNVEAYQLYFKGRSFFYQRGKALFEAVKCFNKALEIDPHYALAFSGLADSYVMLMFHGFLSPGENWQHALEAVEKAIKYGPDLAETYNSIAIIALFYEWDWRKAEKFFRMAIAANPVFIQAYIWYGLFYLVFLGINMQKGIDHIKIATKIDPLSSYAHAVLCWAYSTADHHDLAIREGKYSLNLDPESVVGHLCLGSAYTWSGNPVKGLKHYEKGLKNSGNLWLHTLYSLYHKLNDREKACEIMNVLMEQFSRKKLTPTSLAMAYAVQGKYEKALELLHHACDVKDPNVVHFSCVQKDAKIIREIPGYDEILARTGLLNFYRNPGMENK